MKIALLSGRRSKEFVESVYKSLKTNRKDLEVTRVEAAVENFKNGELNIKLLESVRGDDVIIFQQFVQPDGSMHEDLFELFLLLDTISRSAANSITLCLPFLPYLRQDRKAEGREPISAKTLFNLLQASSLGKLSRIITFDMHNAAEQGFIDLPLDDIPALPLLASIITQQEWFDGQDTVVVAPDVGSAKRAERLVDYLGLDNGVAIVHKERKKGQRAVAKSIIGEVCGKNVVMLDDMIDGGGTLIGAIELLRQNGAKNVLALATHGIFSGNALAEFPVHDVQVIVTDSIPRDKSYFDNNKKWLSCVSIADYTAEVIYANATGSSVHAVIGNKYKIR